MTEPLPLRADRPSVPRPPKHLSAHSKALFRSVVGKFVMESQDIAVLTVGLEALDRANAAREAIDHDGLTIEDRFGQPRPHPLLTAEVQARSQFLAAVKQLGLDYEPVTASGRTAAARAARWSS